jgi:peptidoglycan/LPS O-acetylase OafA/YrhL
MLAATLAFAWPLLRRVRRHFTPGLALAGVGLLAVLFHSLIDLPFRSPAILYAWLAVAGASVDRARQNHVQQGLSHGVAALGAERPPNSETPYESWMEGGRLRPPERQATP